MMNVKLNNESRNSTKNFHSVEFSSRDKTFKVYFSYETPVAVEEDGELVVSENVWTQTTGKHLNWIDPNQSHRVDHEVFQLTLEEILGDMF